MSKVMGTVLFSQLFHEGKDNNDVYRTGLETNSLVSSTEITL